MLLMFFYCSLLALFKNPKAEPSFFVANEYLAKMYTWSADGFRPGPGLV